MNDLEKNEVIWSEVYDFKNKDDIFEVQDLLASSVLRELELKFSVGGSGDALSENPEVYKRQLLGWSAFQYKNSENHVRAEQYFNEALEMEPDNPYLRAAMGWIVLQKVELKLSSNPKKDIEKALSIAQQTLQEQEIFSALALAHVIERKRKNYKNACPYVPKMAEHARSATEFATMGRAQWACDDVQGAISSFERVSLVAPHYSSWYKLPFSFVLTEAGDFQRAKEYMIKELPNLNKARQERLYMLLTYTHLKLGEMNLAEEMYNKWQGQKRDKTAERVVWYLRNNKENEFAKEILSVMEPLSLPPS
jgi:tetratricopeptide (TPR) repeat protein